MHDLSAEDLAWNRYHNAVVVGRPSCALSLIELWDRPTSPSALRFAYHALCRAYRRGLDVMEHDTSLHTAAVAEITRHE